MARGDLMTKLSTKAVSSDGLSEQPQRTQRKQGALPETKLGCLEMSKFAV